MTACQKLVSIIEEVALFIGEEWARRGEGLPPSVFTRDMSFIERARDAAHTCDLQSLRSLGEDLRGISHYFGSYADEAKLLELRDRLYEAWKDAVVADREVKR